MRPCVMGIGSILWRRVIGCTASILLKVDTMSTKTMVSKEIQIGFVIHQRQISNFTRYQECKLMLLSLFFKFIFDYFSWERTCELLQDKLSQFANNSLATGYLELSGLGSESKREYRIAGTEFKYKCNMGFELPNKTNPDQTFQCQGNLQVDTSFITSCVRK